MDIKQGRNDGYSFHPERNEYVTCDEKPSFSNESTQPMWSNLFDIEDYNFLWKAEFAETNSMPPVAIAAIFLGFFIICLLIGMILLIWIVRRRKMKNCYSGRIPKIFIWKRNEFRESRELSSNRASLPSIPPLHSSCNHPTNTDLSERDTWSLIAQWGSITTQDMQTNYPHGCRSFSDSGTLRTPNAESPLYEIRHNTNPSCTSGFRGSVEETVKTHDAHFASSTKDNGNSRVTGINGAPPKEIVLAKDAGLHQAGEYKMYQDNTETPNMLFASSPVSSRVANPCTICTEVCDAMYEIASTLQAHAEVPGENALFNNIPDASNTLQWGANLPLQYSSSLMIRNDSFNEFDKKSIYKEDNDEGYLQCHPAQLQNVIGFDDSESHYEAEHNESEKATQTTFVYPRQGDFGTVNRNCDCQNMVGSNQLQLPASINCKQCMDDLSNYENETESCESILSLFSCFPDEATPIQCTNANKEAVYCKSLRAEYSYGQS